MNEQQTAEARGRGLLFSAAGQITVVVQLGAVAGAVLRALEDAIVHEPHRALTVGELTEAVGVDRPLDAALGVGVPRARDVSLFIEQVPEEDRGRRGVLGVAGVDRPLISVPRAGDLALL